MTRNFKVGEFSCPCGCGMNKISVLLLDELQKVRDVLNAPITIDSGCRCAKHNKEVGGEDHSKHMLGLAADFKVKGFTPAQVHEKLLSMYPDKYGIGLYPTWVHLDVRATKARWSKV